MGNTKNIAFYVLAVAVGVGLGYVLGVKQQVRKTREAEAELGQVSLMRQGFQAKCEELEKELEYRDRQIESLREMVGSAGESDAPDAAPTRGVTESDEAAAPESEPEDSLKSPRVFADRYDGALARVDWQLVGEKTSRMATLIPEIVGYVAAGKTPPLDKAQEIGQLNRPVLIEALKLGEDVPGTGVNGQFTDPAFLLNVLTVTLENTGMPLSERQTERLVAIANRSMADDARRRAAYDDTSYALERLLDEVDLKSRFFDEVFTELTAEQSEFLSPPVTKDRIRADLFSEALIYAGRVEVFPYRDRESLTTVVFDRVKRLIGSDETLLEQARGPVERWVDQLPQDDLLAETNELDKQGMLVASRATRWGRHELALLQSLVTELSLSEETAKGIRGLSSVVVPVK